MQLDTAEGSFRASMPLLPVGNSTMGSQEGGLAPSDVSKPYANGDSCSQKTLFRFQVAYYTIWGQNLKILGSGQTFGDWDPQRAYALSCRHEGKLETLASLQTYWTWT